MKIGVGALAVLAAAAIASAAITLPVTVLPTGFGLPDEPAPTYPGTISVEAPPQLQFSAYGAARRVWLAPRSWTGHGGVGVDGTIVVSLYPVGTDARSLTGWITDDRVGAPHITYVVVSACVRCMLSSAAVYFPDALKQWNKDFNSDGKEPVVVPRDLKVTNPAPHLVAYALPNENGFLVRGEAFYDPNGDGFYEEMRLVLPATEERLAEFLLKYFGDQTGVR